MTVTTPEVQGPRQADLEDATTLYDVAIVGAGCVGTVLARALTAIEGVSVLLIESQAEVGQGVSKANSGIVHAGHHRLTPTLRGLSSSQYIQCSYNVSFAC
ncbi:hypothetical protein KIPB_001627 [Kipferlia bialata]|uniref:FAD dependent oxidoreductase domain-containing protein n=1 Tax=Kipferlia bialata TaxID=797122 RepID=A0A9K3GE99_9EUKA|nr:hypothetical protein KIPB_001627 [Kipferlia bialata]|eukprot:g1627.t1